MPVPSLFQPFIEPLERLDLPYCITGSVASSVYGEPRLTADIDIVLLLQEANIQEFVAAFPDDRYYVPPLDLVSEQIQHSARGMFNIIHHTTQFKADFYLAADDPLQNWAIENRRRIDLGGEGIWVAPPEYVIVRKLEFFREGGSDKHLRDIRFILAATPVQHEFVEREVSLRNLDAQWRRILDDDSVPK